MPIIINCPSCSRQLRVPDDLLGREVKCPTCFAIFTASADVEVAAPPPEEEPPRARPSRPSGPSPEEFEESAAPVRRWRPARSEEEGDEEGYEDEEQGRLRRGRRRDQVPHRGALILALGILGLVCCPFTGPFAWIMGQNDLQAMRAGRMDPEGEGTTNAGRILGIISTVLLVIGMCCGGPLGMLGGRRWGLPRLRF